MITQKKLLLLPLAFVFLATIVSAASVTTSIFYDSTAQRTLTIIDGQNAGVILSADTVLQPNMTISLDLYDSNGNKVSNIFNVFTTKDSYPFSSSDTSDFIIGSSAYKNPGNYTIVSTVIAANGQTATSTLSLQVLPQTPTNHPPVITSFPITQVNSGQSYNYQVTATDADNDPLVYALVQAPSWLGIFSSTGLITGTAPNVASDTNYAVTVQVSDGKSVVTQTYNLAVIHATSPPVITVISPTSNQIFTNSVVPLEITTDKNANIAWFVLDGNNASTVSLSAASQTHFTGSVSVADGSHTITFYAEDSSGNIGQSALISFSVNTTTNPGNHAPMITSSPVISVNENQNYNYQVVATDADNDPLTYSMTGPSWLSINPATGLVSGTAPSVNQDMQYSIMVGVSDGTIRTLQNYTLTVIDTSVPPTPNGPSGGIPRRAGPAFSPNTDFEEQQYLNQFAPITASDNGQNSPVQKNSSALLLVIGIILVVLILAVTVTLIYRSMKE